MKDSPIRTPVLMLPNHAAWWVLWLVVSVGLCVRVPRVLQGAHVQDLLLAIAGIVCGGFIFRYFIPHLAPHRLLPASYAWASAAWGGACALLSTSPDLELQHLVMKLFNPAVGSVVSQWVALPLSHAILLFMGIYLLLALAHNGITTPSEGMKVGLYQGFGFWAGSLLTTVATVSKNHPTPLSDLVYSTFGICCISLLTTLYLAPAIAGVGLHIVMKPQHFSRTRRFSFFLGAFLGYLLITCLSAGLFEHAVTARIDFLPCVSLIICTGSVCCAVLPGFSKTHRVICLCCAALAVVGPVMDSVPYEVGILMALGPLILWCLWRTVVVPECVWIAQILASEAAEYRRGCTCAREIWYRNSDRTRVSDAMASWGPHGLSLLTQERASQILLAHSISFARTERQCAGETPDPDWSTWLDHLESVVVSERHTFHRILQQQAREMNVFQ